MTVTVLLHRQHGTEPAPGTWRAWIVANLVEYADGKFRYDKPSGVGLWPASERYRDIRPAMMRVEAILPQKLPGQKIVVKYHIEE